MDKRPAAESSGAVRECGVQEQLVPVLSQASSIDVDPRLSIFKDLQLKERLEGVVQGVCPSGGAMFGDIADVRPVWTGWPFGG